MMKRTFIQHGSRLYVLQLILGGVLFAMTYFLLGDQIASIPQHYLAEGWDADLIGDLWRGHKAEILQILSLCLVLLAGYSVAYWYWLTIYLQDLAGSTCQIRRVVHVALISILQLVMQLVVLAMCCGSALAIFGDPTQAVSERPFVIGMTAALVLAVVLGIAIAIPMVRAKYITAKGTEALLPAIKIGIAFSWQHKARHFQVIVISILLTLLLWCLGYWMSSLHDVGSLTLTLLSALSSQLVLFLRCVLRAWTIGGLAVVH